MYVLTLAAGAKKLLKIKNFGNDNLETQNALHGGADVARVSVVLNEEKS